MHAYVSVAKTVAVLEEFTNEEQITFVRFSWTNGLNAKGIHKEIFSVYPGKYMSRKVVHNLAGKFSQGRSKEADVAGPSAEAAEK
jgi:hypothetical protein